MNNKRKLLVLAGLAVGLLSCQPRVIHVDAEGRVTTPVPTPTPTKHFDWKQTEFATGHGFVETFKSTVTGHCYVVWHSGYAGGVTAAVNDRECDE
jgi:hypothetical protein